MRLMFSARLAETLSLGQTLFVRLTVCVYSECLSICAGLSFPFSLKEGMWDLIILVPDFTLHRSPI